MVKPREPLAQSSKGKQVASDAPPPQSNKNRPVIIDLVSSSDEEEEVVHDPDPIRWALPANGEPAVVRQQAGGKQRYSQVQLVHMTHLGNKVNWNLKDFQRDHTVVTGICSKIGITRDQFRSWVHNRIKKGIPGKAGSSGTGPGGRSRGCNDQGGPSSAA